MGGVILAIKDLQGCNRSVSHCGALHQLVDWMRPTEAQALENVRRQGGMLLARGSDQTAGAQEELGAPSRLSGAAEACVPPFPLQPCRKAQHRRFPRFVTLVFVPHS